MNDQRNCVNHFSSIHIFSHRVSKPNRLKPSRMTWIVILNLNTKYFSIQIESTEPIKGVHKRQTKHGFIHKTRVGRIEHSTPLKHLTR